MMVSVSTEITTAVRGYFAHNCNQCKCTRPFLALNLTERQRLNVGISGVSVGDDGLGRDLATCDFCGYKIRFKARVVAKTVDWNGDIEGVMREAKSQIERTDAPPNMVLAWAQLNRELGATAKGIWSLRNILVVNSSAAVLLCVLEIVVVRWFLPLGNVSNAAMAGLFMLNYGAMVLFEFVKWKKGATACIRARIGKMASFYKIPYAEIERGREVVRSKLFRVVLGTR